MKTILVVFYNPADVFWPEDRRTNEEIFKYCFSIRKYKTALAALTAYAETPCLWSILLDESADVEKFKKDAYKHITSRDFDWLEQHFT